MKHAMVDLETWGTAPGSALRSIGAVIFDPGSVGLGATFYRNVDFTSQEAIGLVKDPRTEAWWAEQTVDAQLALSEEQVPIKQALVDLARWWVAEGAVYVWGHGANFDPVILDVAYRKTFPDVDKPTPWEYWNVRCCRTVLALNRRKPDRSIGTHHNALDDAKAQARAVQAAFRFGNFNPE